MIFSWNFSHKQRLLGATENIATSKYEGFDGKKLLTRIELKNSIHYEELCRDIFRYMFLNSKFKEKYPNW